MKNFLKKYIIPAGLLKALRPLWHGMLSVAGSFVFGHPSDKLVVIGVTGTNGKTTTVNLLARILQGAGYQVGYVSTATLNIDGAENLNTFKMTMPSGWLLQKWLKQMVERHCQYAILEVSSEGLAQNRHLGINFDVAVFTNLTSEHIEAHGGFENYKKAKGRLFKALSGSKKTGQKLHINPKLQKAIVVNADDGNAPYFAGFHAERYLSFGLSDKADLSGKTPAYAPMGVSFSLRNIKFDLILKGQFDVYNALAATAAAEVLGVPLEVSAKSLAEVEVVPGRVEVLQTTPFVVVVDYAYEPEEMKQLYETVERWPHHRVLQVLGPTGGGRDKARIPTLGSMAAKFADMVIVTTDDPYDDDPQALARRMAEGARHAGKVVDENLFTILDRRAAIARAIHEAGEGDLVLITGKGADQKMALSGGRYIDWDDRKVARQELGYREMNKNKKLDRNWFA